MYIVQTTAFLDESKTIYNNTPREFVVSDIEDSNGVMYWLAHKDTGGYINPVDGGYVTISANISNTVTGVSFNETTDHGGINNLKNLLNTETSSTWAYLNTSPDYYRVTITITFVSLKTRLTAIGLRSRGTLNVTQLPYGLNITGGDVDNAFAPVMLAFTTSITMPTSVTNEYGKLFTLNTDNKQHNFYRNSYQISYIMRNNLETRFSNIEFYGQILTIT